MNEKLFTVDDYRETNWWKFEKSLQIVGLIGAFLILLHSAIKHLTLHSFLPQLLVCVSLFTFGTFSLYPCVIFFKKRNEKAGE